MATRIVRGQKVNQRKMRAPHTNFHIKTRPWQIQPFCIFPVLPGETMQNAMWKSRVVSDPVKNRLIGWWKEYYLFYVRFRDLVANDDFKKIFTDPQANLATYYSAADPKYYHKYGVNFLKMGVEKIVEHYFRVPDDPQLAAAIDGYPAVMVDHQNVLDSAILDADFVGEIDIDVDANADDTITTSEIDKAMRMWQFARANQLTDMDFDDYLRTYGISVPRAQSDKPELLRFVREWQYPTNTVEPTTGVPTTAVSWAIRDRIDKDRMFREPGFVVGLTVARPKVFFTGVLGSFTSVMSDALSWLPAIMRDDPYTSMRKIADGTRDPLNGAMSGDYWVDIKDLFIYGEEFRNHSDTWLSGVAFPEADLDRRYPSLTMARNFFVDNGEAGTKQYVKEDGICNLTIKGALRDTTPSSVRL